MSGRRGNRDKLYQQITDQMVHYIRSGQLKPGDKLPALADMAHQFGVSRAAMREAFSALQGMGLIRMRHGEGTFVASLDLKTDIVEPMNAALLLGLSDLAHLHEVRSLLEASAVKAAARLHRQAELEELSAAIWNVEWGSFDLAGFAAADWRVHIAIGAASGNPILLNLISTLSASMQSVTLWLEESFPHALRVQSYWKIFESVKQRDEKQAESLITEYFNNVWDFYVSQKQESQTD